MVADDYLALVQAFPLKSIRSNKQAEAAFEFFTPLIMKGEDSDRPSGLTSGEADYLAAMTDLLDAFDNTQPHPPDASPTEMLQFLVHERGMSSSDLGRLLGNRSLGTNILNGRRELSKAHIRTLAQHFNVSPALLI